MAIQTQPTVYGVQVTPSIGVKGSWEEFVAATNEQVCLMNIDVTTGGASGVSYLFDIGIGAAGSEVVNISNVLYCTGFQFNPGVYSIAVPVSISSGARVAGRAQANAGGAGDIWISIYLIGGATNSASPVTYGTSTGTTLDTQIDPGAVPNTKGAWSQITASTSAQIEWLIPMISNRRNTGHIDADFYVDIGTGAAASEVVVIPNLSSQTSDEMDHYGCPIWTFPISISSGTRVAARAQSTTADAADRLFGFSMIAVNVVATDFALSAGTGTGVDWFPEQPWYYPRKKTVIHRTGDDRATDPIANTFADVHREPTLPIPRKRRLPDNEVSWNPTPSSPTRVTQTGIEGLQAPNTAGITQMGMEGAQQPLSVQATQMGMEAASQPIVDVVRLTQIGMESLQQPLSVRVTQIGLEILYVAGPGLPPTAPPPNEACPLDDFPVGTGSNREGCTD